jgi:hypothetical protein
MIKSIICVFLWVVLSLGHHSMFGQDNLVKKIILNDFQVCEKCFNDEIFYEKCEDNCQISFNIIKCDTIDILTLNHNQLDVEYAYLISIKIKLIDIPINKQKEVDCKNNNELNYFLIKNKNNYFRLFGFYSTDIGLFYSQYNKRGLFTLSRSLVDKKVILKSHQKKFTRSIIKQKHEYPTKLNMPCQLLFNFYNINWNTIILPLPPLKPYTILY